MAGHGREHSLVRKGGAEAERGILGLLGRHRTAVQVLVDGLAWSVALCFATLVRYDFDFAGAGGRYDGLSALIPLALCVQGLAGMAFGLYTGRSRFGSFEEVMSLVKATVVAAGALWALNLAPDPRLEPASVPVV